MTPIEPAHVVRFSVPGTPVTWKRVIPRRGAPPCNPAEVTAYQKRIVDAYLAACNFRRHRWEGPVWMAVTAYLPVPESFPQWKLDAIRQGDPRVQPYQSPQDRDNFLKNVQDALQAPTPSEQRRAARGRRVPPRASCYLNDHQVTDGPVRKLYPASGAPRLDVELRLYRPLRVYADVLGQENPQ